MSGCAFAHAGLKWDRDIVAHVGHVTVRDVEDPQIRIGEFIRQQAEAGKIAVDPHPWVWMSRTSIARVLPHASRRMAIEIGPFSQGESDTIDGLRALLPARR